jgi:hypothetical protein
MEAEDMNVTKLHYDPERETALILLTDLMARTALRPGTIGVRRELNRLARKVTEMTGERA